ncbi:efflux RND transporter periplasmic adaptor subunit [Kushneria indalinina]|uniref:RND family efflux transporter MFP subunit n=1 Tax=Kushneria indalinina DSM 14324 TaxID=1122140 RepID=A0A3D9DV84_9GAMM|nr:HlyD family secretion protein [Kushneria indalinina]REC94690.1 RND family efflux transporter MFP subunit [Kushneria indalinina DSM 14324]
MTDKESGMKGVSAVVGRTLRIVLTLALVAAALLAAWWIWHHYMHDPWTRDGRIRADIVQVGVDVSGLVDTLEVHDNDLVDKGEVLFTIDQARYQLTLDQAKADLARFKEQRDEAKATSSRRDRLNNYVSQEARDNARFEYRSAEAAVQNAEVAVRAAQLDLERSTVRAPVKGYVTNQQLRPGQYVSSGTQAMTLVDEQSFYALGYFEETKLGGIHPGDPARVRLLGRDRELHGHVDSIARGIVDNSLTGQSGQAGGLAAVNPSFDWVRLSQRIPVRITLDEIPADLVLSAGQTATIYVDAPGHEPAEDGWGAGLRRQLENLFDL